jgi:hypothetical protein
VASRQEEILLESARSVCTQYGYINFYAADPPALRDAYEARYAPGQ